MLPRLILSTALVAAGPALAQTQTIQVRVAVAPPGADALWKKPGVQLEKRVECYRLVTAASKAWPPAAGIISGSGSARAPLFNPGFPKPDGGYVPNSSDDGFNTIFLPLTQAAPSAAILCRGSILVNGLDVTARDGNDVTLRSNAAIASGPPSLTVRATTLTPPPSLIGKGALDTAVPVLLGGFAPGAIIDLDDPRVHMSAGADIKLTYFALNEQPLRPSVTALNGAKIGWFPDEAPNWPKDCSSVAAWTGTMHFKPNRTFCVKTGAGRTFQAAAWSGYAHPGNTPGDPEKIIFQLHAKALD